MLLLFFSIYGMNDIDVEVVSTIIATTTTTTVSLSLLLLLADPVQRRYSRESTNNVDG